MKVIKKLITGIFTLTMVFGFMTAKQSFSVSAESTSTTPLIIDDASIDMLDNWDYTVDANNNIIINKYKGKSSKVVVPSAILGKKVVCIGKRSFANCVIREIVIPEGITEIGDEAFWGCCGLKEVKLPESLATIREGAFQKSSVQTINIPGRVKSISKNAFANSQLSKITISEGVVNIQEGAFLYCSKLIDINLPSTIKTIKKDSFNGTNLQMIDIPNGVSSIDERAFAYTPIEYVITHEGLTEIGQEAFAYCKNLCAITFPEGLKKISDNAFMKSGIIKAVIPKSVTYIGANVYLDSKIEQLIIKGKPDLASNAFVDCKNLENITMDPEFRFNGSVFNGCTSLYRINDHIINGIGYKDVPFISTLIKEFVLNNFRTANEIKFINEYVKNQTHYIVTQIIKDDMSDIEKVVAVQKWICEKVSYNSKDIYNPSNFVDSSVFLNDLSVCDGYARATALLLQEAGIEAYYVGSSNHAWNIVKIGNHYFHIDVTYADSFGNEIVYNRFLKNDTKNYGYNGTWKLYKPSSLYNYSENTSLPECPYMLGDVDMNGTVDNGDYNYICKYLNGKIKIADGDKILADVNYDGKITQNDAQILKTNIKNGFYE